MRVVIAGVLFVVVSAFSPINMGNMSYGSEVLDERFDEIRDDTPTLIAFLNYFPKGADLHNHASGAVYVEHALLFAKEQGYYYDLEKLKIIEAKDTIGISERCIPVAELLGRTDDLRKHLDIVSARGWHCNTMNGQDHFFDTFGHSGAPAYTNEYLADIIARNHSQGIRYLELMSSAVSGNLVKQLEKDLPENTFNMSNLSESFKKIQPFLESEAFQESVKADMDSRENAVDSILREKYDLTIKGETPDVVVRYISQLRRMTNPYSIFVNGAAYMRASTIDPRIVATNMVQDESNIHSLMYFDDQIEVLDFLWKSLDEPNIALHAGELVLRESPVEPMRNRISQSIIKGHASRIGHGVSIAWEEDVLGTLEMMRDQDVVVEICLSSNDMILGVVGDDHPLDMYMQAGVPVTLATDDEAVSRSNLTMEYVKAAQVHDLSYEELKEIAQNGLKYSFLEGDGIYNADGIVSRKYQKYLKRSLPTVSEVGIKEYLQIRHERDLAKFEQRVLKSL